MTSVSRNTTPRFLKFEDFSTYSIILGPDGKLAGVEKQPESVKYPRNPIPTELDETVDRVLLEPVAKHTSATSGKATFEDEITDAEAEKIVEEIAAGSPKLQDSSEDASPATNEASPFDTAVTHAEAEKMVENVTAASPNLQNAPGHTSRVNPIAQEAPLDEAFLAARLDFADPVTFQVRFLCYPRNARRLANNDLRS